MTQEQTAAGKLIGVFFTEEGELTPEALALLPEEGIDEGKEKTYILGYLSSFRIPEEFIVQHAESFNKQSLAIDGHITTKVIEADMEGFSNAVAAAYSNRESSVNTYLLESIFETDTIHPYTQAEVARGALECLYKAIEDYGSKVSNEEGMEFLNVLLQAYEDLFMECGGYIVKGIEDNIFETEDLLAAMMDWTWVIMYTMSRIEVPLEIEMRIDKEVGAHAVRLLDSFLMMDHAIGFINTCLYKQSKAKEEAMKKEKEASVKTTTEKSDPNAQA